MRSTPSHEYGIAPELRRCCWYTIFGAIMLAAVSYWISGFVQNRSPLGVFVACALFALLAAAMVVPLRWKVRVDPNGISRRLLLRWDLWPWAALASGRVRKLHPFTFFDPERPLWRRRLRLEYMAPDDVHEVISMVNAHYKLPPPPDIPAKLAIKYGFRRSATFDRNGIHLIIRDRPYEYLWRDVHEIHVTRMDFLRRDFKSLVVTLPNQELELGLVTHQGGTSPTWRGATEEEINEFLFQMLPADRIHISIAGEHLTKREHIEKKLNDTKKRTREIAIMIVVVLPLLIGALVWMAIVDGPWFALLMGAMSAIFPGSVVFFVYRSQCKEISELSELLSSSADTGTEIAGGDCWRPRP